MLDIGGTTSLRFRTTFCCASTAVQEGATIKGMRPLATVPFRSGIGRETLFHGEPKKF